ncbi:DegT/DnrJ/EryC1/StrS family aminotransferase [bacterium]|nr:DegT/DnrJ/EryC1/StrS family aminotransferase [bacterium]
MKTKMKVPLSSPLIGEEEIEAVVDVLRSSQLSLGPQTEAFEKAFAKTMGSKYAIAVNSGTSGLHLVVRSLGISDGDEVITTPFSFIASSNCILFERATPVFVDVEYDTFNIDPAKIEAAITPKTKAILPVHVFGQSANMTAIMDIAKRHNLYVIEDACESPLATHHGKIVGTFGECGVYGFYPNKQMTTGEGGMIITDNPEIERLCKSYRNQGRGDSMQWLSFARLGYNYRISELTAALGVVQTRKLPEIVRQRAAVADMYFERLKGIGGIKLSYPQPENEQSWFVFGVRVNAEIRDELIKRLNADGIQSKAYFAPSIHLQDFYMEEFGYKEGDYPVSERLSREMLILPFFTMLNEEQVDYVVETLVGHMKELGH